MFMDAAFGEESGAYRPRAFAGATGQRTPDSETPPAGPAEGASDRRGPAGYLIGRMAVRLVLSASLVTWTKVTSPAR